MELQEELHSFAKPNFARVTNIHLELRVDFNLKILVGSALLTIHKLPYITEVILDTYQLVISRVTNFSDGRPLLYFISNHYRFGSSFHIKLSNGGNIISKILIEYKTSPISPALHWLTPEQTADGTHPFLLSHNKLTYARAVFPCQDTPSVKFQFSATISTPKGLQVLMPANIINVQEDLTQVVYKFYQDIPIASYGLVIVVGSLVGKTSLRDRRIHVWAEKKFIVKSIRTFAILYKLLEIAEELCGSYFWGKISTKLFVNITMSPKFSVCTIYVCFHSDFEIECPCLTFVSPTILGGNVWISPISRILSQSWAGHSVTCENYRHLWLNKSFSIFISRKIMDKVFRNNEVMHFYKCKRLANMIDMIFNSENILCDRRLIPNLSHTLPYESTRYVPYEKGHILLWTLENILGGATVFEPFLKSYFETFKTQSITTNNFIRHLQWYFDDKSEIINNFEWNMYFYSTYLPFTTESYYWIIQNLTYLAQVWINYTDVTNTSYLRLLADVELLIDDQKISFLNSLYSLNSILPIWKMRAISAIHEFDNPNDEIRFVWLRLCIKNRWGEKVGDALEFAIQFCSLKIACPIFQDLYEWSEMRQITIETYMRNKRKMIYEIQEKLKFILHLN